MVFRLLFRMCFLKDGNIERSQVGFLLPAQRYRIRDRWMRDASSVLFRCTSHDVQIKWRGSCAICGFASSFGFGMLRRSGSRGLRWNSLMRRRGQCKRIKKKKKNRWERAIPYVHRHTHVTFTRVPAFWCIGFWFPAELTRAKSATAISFNYKSQNLHSMQLSCILCRKIA